MTDQTASIELVDLVINEGSLVDAGDNPEAHIAFFKRAPKAKSEENYPMNMTGEPRTTAQILGQWEIAEDLEELRAAFSASVHEILCYAEPAAMGPMLSKSAEELTAAIEALGLGDLSKKIGEALALAATQPTVTLMQDGITKALSALTPEEQMTEKKTAPATKTFDEILAALPETERAAVLARVGDAEKEAAAAKVKADEEAAAAAEKAKGAEDLTKRLDDLEKRAASAEGEVAKMKDEKLTAHFSSVAKQIGGGDVAKMATMLKSAYARSDDEGKMLEETLRAFAAQAKLGSTLFKSVGSAAPGVDGDAPEAVIEAATKRLMEADPKLGYHAAYKIALANNSDVYARMVNRNVAE